MPKSTWKKDNKTLAKDDNLDLSQTPEFCKILLKKAKRGDTGEYELEMENDSGTDKVPITIKVLGESFSQGQMQH